MLLQNFLNYGKNTLNESKMNNFNIDELYILTEFDPSFSKEKFDELKHNYRNFIGKEISLNDYEKLFTDFPLVQSVIKILFNYQMMLNEFENGKNPFFETTKKLKQHPERLDKRIKEFESALNISLLLFDTKTSSQLERTIKIFQDFRNNPNDLISKLYSFEIMNLFFEDKKHQLLPLFLQWNPFNDVTLKKWEDCIYYLEMLKFFDGYDVSADMLLISTSIKIHKLFELNDPFIFTKVNNPSEAIESIFNKIGKKTKINFERLKYIHPKTFFRGIAIFDYCDEDNSKKINEYFENSLFKTIEYSMTHDRFNNIELDSSEKYYSAINEAKNRLFFSFLNF